MPKINRQPLIKAGLTYILSGCGGAYISQLLPDGRLFLRDMNRSRFWQDGGGSRQGWAEGFLWRGEGERGRGGALVPYEYEVADGRPPVLREIEGGIPRSVGAFVRCGIKRRVVAIEEWLGL